MQMNDMQTMIYLIEQIESMRDQNYSLIPNILNEEETIQTLQRVRDFLVSNKVPSIMVYQVDPRRAEMKEHRLKKEELKPGMPVEMFNMRAQGIAIVLSHPYENMVEVYDPNGEVQFTNANYLLPVIYENR